ncbi:choice-of-anchor A family protein [Kitasatospora sp. NPDC048286]|uniref:choice-of-anchor A family protein n=1 Tax=Kitasatospora sp. NPDC048286 TaxID=3364047 RepID=UPI003723F359
MRISTSAAALAVGGSLALAGLVAPAAQAVGADQECRSLGVANLYGEFIEGNDTHTPDAEGAVAVGGNADFTGGFSVGQELTPAEVDALPGKNALVVAGKITGHNTQVMKGNGVYGSKADGSVVQAHQGTVAQGPSPIDFKAEFAKLRAASTSLAAVPQTAGATVQAEGAKLTFTGGDAKYNSFTIDAAKLQGAKEVYVKVPVGAVTVINVTGGSYDMAAAGTSGFLLWDQGKSAFVLDDKSQSASGGAIRSKLLWNFPTATKVTKKGDAAWAGTVLAPNAAVSLNTPGVNGGPGTGGAPINGSVIAASLTGTSGAETHHYPFTGCLPGTTVPTPSGTPTVPPTVPSGSPSATPSASGSPSGSASPSGGPSAPVTGTPGASGSASASAGGSTAVPAASGSPSARPDAGGDLAHTGSGPVLPLAVGGAVVLAAGGAIVVAARRKAARKA